ncbi:MAG: ATP-binding protein [Pseudomonadota bacterium]
MPFVPRIRTILVGAFLLAAGLPLALFWAWPQTSFQTFQMDEVRNRQALLARNLAATMGAYHDDLVTALRSFAPLIADGRGEEVRTSLEKLHFTRICVVNPDTGAVTRSFLGESRGCPDWYSESRRKMFVDLAGNAGVGMSPVAFAVNGPAEINMATRAYDVLIVGAISTQFFQDLRAASDADDDGYTAIVDQTGHVLAHPVTLLQDVPTDLGYLEPVQQILAGNIGAASVRSDGDGSDMIAGFAVVDGPGWGVFIPRPIANLQRAATKIEQEGLAVLALALCLSGFAGLLIARFISNQVSGIERKTRMMAGGDRTERFANSGPGAPRIRELSDLSTSLNIMADDIDAAHESELHLREAAEQAAAAKAEFLENLSGEIRTPVTNMMSMTDLIHDGATSDLQSRQLDAIADSGRILLGLLDDILDFSQIEAGQMHLKREPVDLSNIALSVTRLMMPAAMRKGIELLTRVPPETPLVIGDAARLRQFLLNLVGNAVKFTDEGHVIVDLQVVPVDEGAASVQIEISDTGVGISPERMDKIFAAFESAGEEQTAAGLGLAICQRITSAMNGSLAVESELGSGSTFRFIAQLPMASPYDLTATPISGAFSDLRVMVLAAHEKQRDILAGYLESFGLTERYEGSADPAIKVMAGDATTGSGIDVLVYDPAGFDFGLADLRRLMTRHKDHRCPRLIVLSEPSALADGISETARLLDKPVVPADLCAALLQAGTKEVLHEPIADPASTPDRAYIVTHAQSASLTDQKISRTGRPGFLRPASAPKGATVMKDSPPETHAPGLDQNAVQLFTISSIHRDESPSVNDRISVDASASTAAVMEPMPPAITEILEKADAPRPAIARETSERTVILVDGSSESQSEIAMVLDQFEISTDVARDGKAAIRAMMATPDVAAVLIDLKSMAADAMETAQRISEIKTDLCNDDCMIIGLAESGRGTQERDLRAAGFTHLLKKPVKKSVMQRLFGADPLQNAKVSAARSA